jgi:hypothetical protein
MTSPGHASIRQQFPGRRAKAQNSTAGSFTPSSRAAALALVFIALSATANTP